MEQILDVDAGQPPYVELFTHHPLMFMSLGNHRMDCKQATPKELLFWSHSVQCKIDDVAAALGLYKIRMLGPCCMFASTPEMPAKQQAGVMFTAAKRLSSILAEASLPGGDALATQITIHAGKYAGGVVGKGSWTYEVFGSDVQDLLDMDRFCSPNSIQVSDPVLSLLGLETAQFAPSCKLLCGGHEVLLHRWLGQAADGPPGMQAGTAAAAAAAARKGVIGLVMLQQRWQLPGAAAGMAAAGAAAEGLLRMQQSAAGMLRRRALAMLVESLGFKVRFKTHLLTLTLNVAATTLGVLWQCWSGAAAPATAAAAAGSPGPWLWELLLQLCVGCVAPTVLLYFWEADERAAFVGGSAPGSRRCSVDEPAEYDDACGAAMPGKAKAL
ncbi:hypothetical protein OEZ85_011633 [Tetradesmus obliquus]|uniref:Guanylate cyclase domain-containing protein n=1 Tax=Tetradesmus obliquus TaxID=3088 RepID=A0ABY8TT91_TETOB|nr:hypothetical protein OEZ85_011633 [Tetradesmus obliquus]